MRRVRSRRSRLWKATTAWRLPTTAGKQRMNRMSQPRPRPPDRPLPALLQGEGQPGPLHARVPLLFIFKCADDYLNSPAGRRTPRRARRRGDLPEPHHHAAVSVRPRPGLRDLRGQVHPQGARPLANHRLRRHQQTLLSIPRASSASSCRTRRASSMFLRPSATRSSRTWSGRRSSSRRTRRRAPWFHMLGQLQPHLDHPRHVLLVLHLVQRPHAVHQELPARAEPAASGGGPMVHRRPGRCH